MLRFLENIMKGNAATYLPREFTHPYPHRPHFGWLEDLSVYTLGTDWSEVLTWLQETRSEVDRLHAMQSHRLELAKPRLSESSLAYLQGDVDKNRKKSHDYWNEAEEVIYQYHKIELITELFSRLFCRLGGFYSPKHLPASSVLTPSVASSRPT